tara:strand:+ start:892 stop:1164 length:273 start_codon:yes stop_codon:yes gene_type:complete
MAEVIVGGNTFEISSKNKNWTCCDLKDGFLVLVNWDINEDDIVEEIEESQFTDAEHNTFFKSKRNRAYCFRFKMEKNREEELHRWLDKFN